MPVSKARLGSIYNNNHCVFQPKERKKGQKEINKDNSETLSFYWKFTGVASVSTACLNLPLSHMACVFSSDNPDCTYYNMDLVAGV